MTTEQLRALLASSCVSFAPTGSRYICDPAPTDTDEDYVCLANNATLDTLRREGFEQNTEESRYAEMPDFIAFRLGEFNVIVTEDAQFYALFVEATEEAKRLNLMEKGERIELFQKILYGVDTPNAGAGR